MSIKSISPLPSPILSLSKISVVFGEKIALKNISLELKKGEYVGLIGPNGAGKSTLLRVLLGLQKPSSGKREISKNVKMGYVPQNYILPSALPISVQEVLQMGAENSLNTKKSQKILKEVGLEEVFLKKNFHSLSGGQKQRVIIARALISHPDILFFDEPLSGVDFTTKVKIYELLSTLNAEKKITILFVSHEIDHIIKQCHRVLCLNTTLQEGCHLHNQGILPDEDTNTLSPIHHHHSLFSKSYA